MSIFQFAGHRHTSACGRCGACSYPYPLRCRRCAGLLHSADGQRTICDCCGRYSQVDHQPETGTTLGLVVDLKSPDMLTVARRVIREGKPALDRLEGYDLAGRICQERHGPDCTTRGT